MKNKKKTIIRVDDITFGHDFVVLAGQNAPKPIVQFLGTISVLIL